MTENNNSSMAREFLHLVEIMRTLRSPQDVHGTESRLMNRWPKMFSKKPGKWLMPLAAVMICMFVKNLAIC